MRFAMSNLGHVIVYTSEIRLFSNIGFDHLIVSLFDSDISLQRSGADTGYTMST